MRGTEREYEIKPFVWIGASHEVLKGFLSEIQGEMGYALSREKADMAQTPLT